VSAWRSGWIAAATGLAMALPAIAQSELDLEVTGQMGVGTMAPKARLEVQTSSREVAAVQVLDAGDRPIFVIDGAGRVGVRVAAPEARLDIAPDSAEALTLASGSLSTSPIESQIIFEGKDATRFRYGIRTTHSSAARVPNNIEFFFREMNWPRPGGDAPDFTIGTANSASGCGVGIRAAGTMAFELDISSGTIYAGGGTVLALHSGEHADAATAASVRYLDEKDEKRAYEETEALKPAAYRIKPDAGGAPGRITRGLIYEELPGSLRGREKSVVVDARVTNLELALKEINRRIAELERKVALAERTRRR